MHTLYRFERRVLNLIRLRNIVFILFLALVNTACSSSSEKLPKENEAYACQRDLHIDKPMAQLKQTAIPSEFLPLHSNSDAYLWRLALIDKSQTSLDIQTFIWEEDETGRLLIERIWKAADRGVYVRLLIDDFLFAGRDGVGTLLNNHPNIEIRVFNPLKVRSSRMAFRGIEIVKNLSRLNHRMHNKLFVADNKIAIIGGRNIGNEYFGIGNKLNYRDFDLVAHGQITPELTDSFNVFWNSAHSYPLENVADAKLVAKSQMESAQHEARSELSTFLRSSELLAKEFNTEAQDWQQMLQAKKESTVTGNARIIYDCPPSRESPIPGQASDLISKLAMSVEKEIFLISPYLVPSELFRSKLNTLTERGVRVRILTNSLGSSDSAAAVSGYARHRKELLEMGVELFEMRSDAKHTGLFKAKSSSAKFLSLHAKVIIFDSSKVYVGSLNLDPRSIVWNTEIGALIDSHKLTQLMLDSFEKDLKQENSWKVSIDENGNVIWSSEKETRTTSPARNFFQHIAIRFYSLLPIENQL